MKARFYPVVLSLACACSFLPATAQTATDTPYLFLDPDDPSYAEVRRHGEQVIDQVGGAMIFEIRRILASTAAAQAVGAVHLKDYKLPPAAAGQPRVTAVRRTSLRVRNPANAPDAADRAALERIRDELERGDDVSKLLLQRVTLPGQPAEWRVYRPLVALKQCLECHGAPTTLAPGVAEALQAAYPEDKAVDYRAGEWRGLIRISLAWPAN